MNSSIIFPGNLFYDIGDSFIAGFTLGTFYYFIKGCYLGRRGYKIKSGIDFVSEKAPKLGGNFAIWSLCYDLSYYCFYKIRKKNDILNLSFSGFNTGFIFNIRNNFKSAIKSGILSSFFITFFEIFNKINANRQRKLNIIKDNELINLYKKEFEKKGIKFLENQNFKYKNDEYLI